MLPGSPLAALAELPAVDPSLAARRPRALARLGVAARFAVEVIPVVALDGGSDGPSDGDPGWWADWAEDAAERLELACPGALDHPEPPTAVDVALLRPLGAVRPDAWPEALALAAADPAARRALLDPVRVVAADGRSAWAPGPSAWRIGRLASVGATPLADLRLPGDDRLDGVFDPVPEVWAAAAGPDLLAALGARTTVERLLEEPDGPQDLLDRLADEGRAIEPAHAAALHRALSAVDPDRVDPPDRVRCADGVVRPADEAVVAAAPYLLPLLGTRPVVAGDARLADLLDLDLARVEPPPLSADAVTRPTPPIVARLLPEAPATYVEQDDLAVDWWVDEPADGPPVVRAATMDGLARGLAWAAGRWPARHLLAEALADPARGEALAREAAWD